MKHRLQSNHPEALVHQQNHAPDPVFNLPVAPQLDINTGICAGISLSFFLLALQSLNLMVLNLMGPVLPVQHSFLNLCPSLLYRREQTQMQDLNMCVFTHRAFSCWVCSSFLSHHMDLWKPHVTIFMLFCIFPSEGATDTWFPLLPSLALSDRVRGHCHLLILNSCLHWYSIHPPYILRCPLLLTLKNFSKCSVLPEQGCPIEDLFFTNKCPWIITQNSQCCMWEYIKLCFKGSIFVITLTKSVRFKWHILFSH